MRNYKNIDRYLNVLAGDIYPQPEDDGHSGLAKKVIDTWMSRMTSCKSVLDVGCGTGFCQPMFSEWGVEYTGVCLGHDYTSARESGRNVHRMDYHFLEYEDKSFDMIFSRHSLEHSPMPLLALMEWERVSRQWLGLVMPAPEWYTYSGLNHYSVMNQEQLLNILARAGWKPIWNEVSYLKQEENDVAHEYWIMCERTK